MKRSIVILGCCLMGACSPTSPASPDSTASSSASSASSASSSSASAVIEQLPSELSIDHFAHMTLVGTGLTLREVERNSAYVHYNADYLSNGLHISGIMKIPLGKGPFPLVLANHGHIATSVYTRGRGLKREEDYLARHGYAVFHSDYRGHADSDESPDTERRIYDAGLEYAMDVVNALNAVHAAKIANVDASRVAMLGHSMGGGVTMDIATAFPDLLDAVVLYAPVNTDGWENFNRWRRDRDDDDRTEELYGVRAEHADFWDGISSKTYLNQLQSPVLLFQGTKDADVPKEWSDGLNAELKRLGKDVTYVVYEGEKHEFIPQWNNFMETMTAFLREKLAVKP